MSHVSNKSYPQWSQPPLWITLPDYTDIGVLKARAAMVDRVRDFFAKRDVFEVDTPLLCPTTGTDIHIQSLQVLPGNGVAGYLQTSPEFAMKKLLSKGSGSIYQIAKAFRGGEVGRLHRVEFTMLEWYRVGFDHFQLMDEVDALLGEILDVDVAERLTYQQAFKKYLDIDPHTASMDDLQACAVGQLGGVSPVNEDRDFWLQLLFSHGIEPKLGIGYSHASGKSRPTCVYHFPASQAALAKVVQEDGVEVAQRFEFYFQGVELANGYHELMDAQEQRRRFEADLAVRRRREMDLMAIDEDLLDALDNGFPDCAGVALGIDRLLMLSLL